MQSIVALFSDDILIIWKPDRLGRLLSDFTALPDVREHPGMLQHQWAVQWLCFTKH